MRLPSSSEKNLLVRRVEIAQEALDEFRGKPFVWGSFDCARLGAFVLRRCGYKPNLARFGDYKTELAARRALARQGHASLASAVDALGPMRIAPAATLPCDLIAFPGQEGGLDGLTVVLGNGRVLGFTEAAEHGACSIIDAHLQHATAAWSVPPWRK
jgi:hypothetical protein